MDEINREKLCEQLSLKAICFMKQTHSDLVKVVIDKFDDLLCDALVTSSPEIGLAALAADCMPITFSSDGVIGVAHVGRVGLLKGIASKTVDVMRELGADKIRATIGPSICGSCYEVSSEMYREFTSQFPASSTSAEQHSLDLQRAVIAELQNVGVETQNLGICTLENSGYFSFRAGDVTSREAGIISL